MHPMFVLKIFADFVFERSDIPDYISMRDDHSLWVGRCAGSEDDFQGVVGSEISAWVFVRGMMRDACCQLFQDHGRHTGIYVRSRADGQHCADLAKDALGEIGRGGIIHWNHDDSTRDASEERGHPLCPIRAPNEYAISFADIAGLKFAGKLKSGLSDLKVGPALSSITAFLDVGSLRTQLEKFGQIFEKGAVFHPQPW